MAWYSATWQDDNVWMKSILDFDDQIEVKHPESKTTAICFDDLRLGPTRPFFYSIPNWLESLDVTAQQSLASPLGPIKIKLHSGDALLQTIEMNVDDSMTIDAALYTNLRLESSHELAILGSAGQGGAALITPDNPSKIDNTGRSWTIPLSAGESVINVISKDANMITTMIDGDENTAVVNSDISSRIGSNWQTSIVLSEPGIISVTTSAPSHLILITEETGNSGIINLRSASGAYMGTEFLITYVGFLELTNPSLTTATATWQEVGYRSLARPVKAFRGHLPVSLTHQ